MVSISTRFLLTMRLNQRARRKKIAAEEGAEVGVEEEVIGAAEVAVEAWVWEAVEAEVVVVDVAVEEVSE